MKNKLLKGVCLSSALFATSLVSCNKSTPLKDMHTEIQSNFFNQMFNLTLTKQIKNRALWKRFVDVYRWKEDDSEVGVRADWRCEYWGKMMRGAVLCYKYSQDDELYDVLTETVKELLSIQEENGRFSSYSVEKEFRDWDIWGRKYIMTSLLHYYEICKDATLKSNIIDALKKHADYIVSKIGEGKLDITRCGSEAYNVKGLNASTILEPFVNLYEVTKDKKYLDFAKYIIDKGGTHVGNMIDALKNNNLLPNQYPIHKAYETLSFFEGVYRYARVVDDKDLANLVIRFFEKVYENEITVIGGAGNHEEDFDHSITSQIHTHNPDPKSKDRFGYGIETCVTVTWMRVLNVLYENTCDIKYYNRFTQSAMNAFLGSVNLYDQKNYTQFGNDDSITDGLPFDSYSPLCYDSRGLATGGLCKFKPDASFPFYGCCVCIAPASVGLMGINYARQFDNKLYLNEYYSSEIKFNKGNINIGGTYLYDGKVSINLNCDSTDELLLRIPEWANNPKVIINNEVKNVTTNSYYSAGSIKNIKNIAIEFNPIVEKKSIEDGNVKKYYFVYGPHTLALDEFTNKTDFSATEFENVSGKNISPNQFTINAPVFDNGELIRFTVPYNGKNLILTNYASAGRKHYKAAKTEASPITQTRVTVFLNDN